MHSKPCITNNLQGLCLRPPSDCELTQDSDRKNVHNLGSTQFSGPKTSGMAVRSGTWSSVTHPTCRVRSQSFRLEHAPSTMLLGIFLLMAACTSSTRESSSNLY